MIKLLLLSLWFTLISCNTTITHEYILIYEGNTPNNTGTPTKFSTAFNTNYQLFNENTLEICKASCNRNNLCKGLFYQITTNNNHKCFGLSNLGYSSGTSSNSYSYIKTIHHHYHHELHNIYGSVYENFEQLANISIYLDMNHNGIYDSGEPISLTTTNGEFSFYNLTTITFINRVSIST